MKSTSSLQALEAEVVDHLKQCHERGGGFVPLGEPGLGRRARECGQLLELRLDLVARLAGIR